LNEREFTKQVIDVAHQFGWLIVHFLPGQAPNGRPTTRYLGDGKGYFDITAIRERIVFAELKIPPNTATTEQKIWAQQAIRAGAEVYLWKPADYDDIVKVFAGARPPRTAVLEAA
jgi:hypothetical protein